MKNTIAVLMFVVGGLAFTAVNAADTPDDKAIASGKKVYGKYCAKCHGVNTDGRGKDAYKYKPAPTNFTISQAARPYMVEITKKGGKAMNQSEDMPSWDGDLNNQQIEDAVSYVMSVRKKH